MRFHATASKAQKAVAILTSSLLLSLPSTPAFVHTNSGGPVPVGFGPASQNPATPTGQMMAMPLVVPLFIQNENFSSTLILTNSADQSTYADVILTGTDGREITRQRVEFRAHSQRDIEIGSLLQSVVSGFTMGSISILRSPDLRGAVILGQLSMTYHGSQNSYIDEEVAMPSPVGSQTLRGVGDAGSGSPLVAIASVSEAGQHVAIQCFLNEGESRSKSVDLLPGETLLTEGCAERTIHGAAMESLLAPSQSPDHDSLRGPVGISLTSDAKPGSFVAFGLVPREKDGEQFFSTVNFSDPKMLLSATTIFTGVPVGPATLLPEANYVPSLSLTNFSAKDLQVHVQYAQTSGSSPMAKEIVALTVRASSSKAITFDNLEGDPQLENSFLVTSNGAPGDVLSKLVSKSDSALLQVETAGKDQNDPNNTGNHPWSLEGGTESTLLLFNHATEPQNFDVVISGSGVRWQRTYQLKSMQTEAINIRDLIERRLKDETGKTLPQSAQSGQVSWFIGAAGQGKGRLLQSNRGAAMARNFSCGAPGGLCSASFSPATTDLLIDDTAVNFGTATGIQCTADPYNPQPCFGTFNGPGSGYIYQWVSNDGTVIGINSSTTVSTSSTVYVDANDAGTTGVHANISSSQGCYQSAGAQGRVHKPASLQVLSSSIISDSSPVSSGGAGCTTAQNYSVNIKINYQVLDQNQAPLNSSKMEPQEKDLNQIINGQNFGSSTDWEDIGGHSNFPGTSMFTNANGQFLDAPVGICIAVPFTETDTQIISILLNRKRYPVSTDPNAALRTNN